MPIPSLSVRTMVMMPPVAPIPNAPAHIRGVINLRGTVLPLVDLRMRCGMEPLSQHIESLCTMLAQREQDHRRWMAELKASMDERRAFTLATDPHKCAFGKWYDRFESNDLVLSGIMKEFDEPHKAIHAVAHRVLDAAGAGDYPRAQQLIEQTEQTVLRRLLELFAAAQQHLRTSTREIALVLESRGTPFALAVDQVESTETLASEGIASLPAILTAECKKLVLGVAQRKKDRRMVLLLDVEALFDGTLAA